MLGGDTGPLDLSIAQSWPDWGGGRYTTDFTGGDAYRRLADVDRNEKLAGAWEGTFSRRWRWSALSSRKFTRQQRMEADIHDAGPVFRAGIGRSVLQRLGRRWLKRRMGRYVAVTLAGQPIADGESLEQLYEILASVNLQEDYYVAHVGYPTIGQLR